MSTFVILYDTVVYIGSLGGTPYVRGLIFDLIFICSKYFPLIIINFVLNDICSACCVTEEGTRVIFASNLAFELTVEYSQIIFNCTIFSLILSVQNLHNAVHYL